MQSETEYPGIYGTGRDMDVIWAEYQDVYKTGTDMDAV